MTVLTQAKLQLVLTNYLGEAPIPQLVEILHRELFEANEMPISFRKPIIERYEELAFYFEG